MPKTFTLHVTNKRTNETTAVSGEIPDQEWARLLRFIKYCDDLASIELVKTGVQGYGHVSWSPEKGFFNPHPLPPASHIREFLHVLRHIILSDEPSSFEKVTGILARYLTDPQFRSVMKRITRSFSGDATGGLFTLQAGDLVLNSEAALKLWLNALEYHGDEDKIQKVEALREMLPDEVTRSIFLSLLVDKARAALQVAEIIRSLDKSIGSELNISVRG